MQQLDKQFIDNRWVASHGSRRLAVVNPYTEQTLAEVTAGDSADVDDAVAAARRALPAWRALSGTERARYLDGFAEVLTRRREELVRLSSTNNGKALAEAGIDLDDAIDCYRYYAGQARALDARQGQPVALEMDGVEAACYFDPVGVVGLITPWNFPLVTSAWKLAPALAAGCTAVFKPSEVTPLPEQALAEIAEEIGLPAGVFNLVHGDGEGVGAPLSAAERPPWYRQDFLHRQQPGRRDGDARRRRGQPRHLAGTRRQVADPGDGRRRCRRGHRLRDGRAVFQRRPDLLGDLAAAGP